MKTAKKMIDGEYYLAGDPVLVKIEEKQNLLHRLNVTEYRMTKSSRNN
jgi:maltose O-acetyltransferase